MKLLGYLLLVSVVLAAIKAAVTALVAAAVLAGIVCLVRRPRETLVAVTTISVTFAFVAHPLIIGSVALAAAILGRIRMSE